MAATVPVYNSQKVQAGGPSNARFRTPDTSNVMGNQVSNQPNRIGEVITRTAIGLQEMANQTRINDAINQAKEAALDLKYGRDRGYTNLKGVDALQRPDNKPLGDEYGDHLRQSLSGIEAKLGNDAQRQAFREWSGGFSVGFREDLMRYEAKQFNDYSLSVSDGVIANAQNTIGYEWSNPGIVAGEVERIQAEVFRSGRLQGLSAEQIEANQRTATSSAHALVAVSALQNNNPAYADMYLNQYANQMNANDLLKVRGLVTTEMDNQVGFSVANEAFTLDQKSASASDFNRAFDILIGTESRGKQFDADGQPLTSSAGAIGVAQVMPDTAPEAAKLAGLPWDEYRYKNDSDYNRALGMAYFQKQLQSYGGDLAKAYAAYNAGPGRLNEALQEAQKPENAGRSWLDFTPKETRNYVAKNIQEFSQGQMRRSNPSLKEMKDQIRNDPRVANNPNRLKVALGETERRYNEQQAEIKQKEEETVREAQVQLQSNGGRYADLPLDLRSNVPPEKVDDLITYGQKVNNPYAANSSPLLYQKLSDPTYLNSLSESDLYNMRGELTESDFGYFVKQWNAENKPSSSSAKSPEVVNSSAVNSYLDNILRMQNINPNPPAKDEAAVARVAAIRQVVNEAVLAEQVSRGKQLSEREVSQFINEISMQKVELIGTWGGKSSVGMLSVKESKIPNRERRLIESAFNRQGISNPTDGQILYAYLTRKHKDEDQSDSAGGAPVNQVDIFKDMGVDN